jgi:hypothetical protein
MLAAACAKNRPDPQPADFVFVLDKSATSPLSNDEKFAALMGQKMHDALLAEHPILGDRTVILNAGKRDTKGAISRKVPINRQYPAPAVARYVQQVIARQPHSPDNRQDESSILFTLTHGDFKCTPGRGRVWVISDMLNNDVDFSDVRGLLAGTAQLPPQEGKPLAHCRVSVVAIGLTADGTMQLSSAQISDLIAAYRLWFVRAGVAPGDLDFTTGI